MDRIEFKTFVSAWVFCMTHPFMYSIHQYHQEGGGYKYFAVRNRSVKS